MASKLFSNKSFNKELFRTSVLPNAYREYIEKNGGTRVSHPDFFSVYNTNQKTYTSTLHEPTIEGITKFAANLIAESTNSYADVAYGTQTAPNGEIMYVLKEEFFQEQNRSFVLAYCPKDGTFKGADITNNGKTSSPVSQIDEINYFGTDCFELLAFYQFSNNKEFEEEFEKFFFKKRNTAISEKIQHMFVMCDNLYRCIETVDTNDRIPIYIPTSGNIFKMSVRDIETGVFAPTEKITGTFHFLMGNPDKIIKKTFKNINEMKKQFSFRMEFPEKLKKLIPVMEESYKPSAYVTEMAMMVKKGGMRKFMCRGTAGTGKTTDARALAAVLELPYRRFTCSENTDEMEIVASMIPNTGTYAGKRQFNIPTFENITIDPASALAKVTGNYEDGISAENAFKKIVHAIAAFYKTEAGNQKDYIMVESQIIEACKHACVIEIQEPACIRKPGTLVKLNSLLDDGMSITLLDGTEIKRNPNTVFVFTTNADYQGCHEMNESVLSRMDEIIDYDTPTAALLTERVMRKYSIKEEEKNNIRLMAETIAEIQKYCRTNMITGGVSSTREFENWVLSYLVKEDMKEACKFTVLSKISSDEEIRQEVYQACIKPRI